MTDQEFGIFVNSLLEFWGKPKDSIPATQSDLWFKKVKSIPAGDPLRRIYQRITDEHDSFPRNLPKTMTAIWQEMRDSHEVTIVRDERECPDDCQDGLIFAERTVHLSTGSERAEDAVFRCARCARSNLHGIPAATRAGLEKCGWRFNIGIPGVYDMPVARPEGGRYSDVLKSPGRHLAEAQKTKREREGEYWQGRSAGDMPQETRFDDCPV